MQFGQFEIILIYNYNAMLPYAPRIQKPTYVLTVISGLGKGDERPGGFRPGGRMSFNRIPVLSSCDHFQ